MSELILDIDRPEEISVAAFELARDPRGRRNHSQWGAGGFRGLGCCSRRAGNGRHPWRSVPAHVAKARNAGAHPCTENWERSAGRGLDGGWPSQAQGVPLGVVGHWPAGNIEIQPLLSMTCALLGGNACLVRVPSGLEDISRQSCRKLVQTDTKGVLTDRIRMLVFPHARRDLQEAMARSVDGAMVWGGEEAVLQVRSLPFPHWARIAIFGPRISVAAMDADSWCNSREREAWCRRIARDVWQFDQQACSSPQVLFLEKKAGHSCDEFVAIPQESIRSGEPPPPETDYPCRLDNGNLPGSSLLVAGRCRQ